MITRLVRTSSSLTTPLSSGPSVARAIHFHFPLPDAHAAEPNRSAMDLFPGSIPPSTILAVLSSVVVGLLPMLLLRKRARLIIVEPEPGMDDYGRPPYVRFQLGNAGQKTTTIRNWQLEARQSDGTWVACRHFYVERQDVLANTPLAQPPPSRPWDLDSLDAGESRTYILTEEPYPHGDAWKTWTHLRIRAHGVGCRPATLKLQWTPQAWQDEFFPLDARNHATPRAALG
jgi:hypothetical protein